ncbi:unnamed protein product [Urochloa decumbens]|uniref:Osmotin-like protein n=1 Tax=Urochloa decumbens TaxID=240449 RepID=A0ABC9H7V6_9POAL
MSSPLSKKKTLAAVEALMMAFLLALASATASSQPPATGNLTLHNLCPFPVWPLVTANAGVPTDARGEPAGHRLDGHGWGLVTLAFPPGAWSGRVVARTGCTAVDEDDGHGDVVIGRCLTGDTPPVTVAQVSVGGGPERRAAYSVSLVDGFNVAVVVTPHGFAEGRRCPTLGCAADLAAECPVGARGPRGGCGGGGTSEAAWFKARCPDTRTNATDVEATPQDCVAPGEIKVVFCPNPDSVGSYHALVQSLPD